MRTLRQVDELTPALLTIESMVIRAETSAAVMAGLQGRTGERLFRSRPGSYASES